MPGARSAPQACQSHKPPKKVFRTKSQWAARHIQCWCFRSVGSKHSLCKRVYASHIGGQRAEALIAGCPPVQHAIRQRRKLEARRAAGQVAG